VLTDGYITGMALARGRHPNKEVEAAVAEAESQGWTLRKQGHWGRLYCAHADRDGCQISVNSTPRDGDVHAKQIRRAIDRCPHKEEADDENV
jgi:hypothetical protein